MIKTDMYHPSNPSYMAFHQQNTPRSNTLPQNQLKPEDDKRETDEKENNEKKPSATDQGRLQPGNIFKTKTSLPVKQQIKVREENKEEKEQDHGDKTTSEKTGSNKKSISYQNTEKTEQTQTKKYTGEQGKAPGLQRKEMPENRSVSRESRSVAHNRAESYKPTETLNLRDILLKNSYSSLSYTSDPYAGNSFTREQGLLANLVTGNIKLTKSEDDIKKAKDDARGSSEGEGETGEGKSSHGRQAKTGRAGSYKHRSRDNKINYFFNPTAQREEGKEALNEYIKARQTISQDSSEKQPVRNEPKRVNIESFFLDPKLPPVPRKSVNSENNLRSTRELPSSVSAAIISNRQDGDNLRSTRELSPGDSPVIIQKANQREIAGSVTGHERGHDSQEKESSGTTNRSGIAASIEEIRKKHQKGYKKFKTNPVDEQMEGTSSALQTGKSPAQSLSSQFLSANQTAAGHEAVHNLTHRQADQNFTI
jgi:hypothetical protein